MRIGIFTTDFPFKEPFSQGLDKVKTNLWGGVAEVVYHLALNLNGQGHVVKVFTTSPTDKDFVREHQNVTVYAYGSDLSVASTMLSSRLLWKPLEHDLDIVHGHMGTPPGAFAASFYSRMKRVPLVTTIHTPYNNVSMEGASLAKRLSLQFFTKVVLPSFMKTNNAITTVSWPVLEESPEFRPYIPRSVLIENGVDVTRLTTGLSKKECRDRLGIDGNKKVVLFVGSMSPYKNPEILFNAFSGLDLENSDLYLVMLGDGVLRPGILERAKNDPRTRDRVRIPGFVSEQEKLLYYGAADIFSLPSLAEAFPLTLIEASIYGLPLLLSDIDIFREVVEKNHNGVVFRGGDVKDLQGKLADLFEDEPERSRMGQNSRKFAETHDWHALVAQYCEIYKRLVP